MWDLSDPDVFSPRWGSFDGGLYALANGLSDTDAVQMAAQGFAHVISDTLIGMDSPLWGDMRMWTTFTLPAPAVLQLAVAFIGDVATTVLVDGVVVTGSSCPVDRPASAVTCTSMPCELVDVSVDAGSHEIDIMFALPGQQAILSLTTSDGRVVAATNASWKFAWDAIPPAQDVPPDVALAQALLNGLPEPPATSFTLVHPDLGYPILIDTASASACGPDGALRIANGKQAVFSLAFDSHSYDAAAGFAELDITGYGVATACSGFLSAAPSASGGAASFRVVQLAQGTVLVCSPTEGCLGYDLALDMVTVGSSPVEWQLRTYPSVPSGLGALYMWNDGSDAASIQTNGSGISSWRDTRDTHTMTPRTMFSANPPQYRGPTCPAYFSDGQLLTGSLTWDFALPTTVVMVITRGSAGTLVASQTLSGAYTPIWSATNNSRAFAIGSRGSVQFLAAGVAPAATADGLVPLRNRNPTVIVLVRTTRTTWTVYVNGIAQPSVSFALPYASGTQTVVIGSSFTGCVCEYMIYGAALNATSVQSVSDYLQTKWSALTATSANVVSSAAPPPPLPPTDEGSAISLPSSGFAVVAGKPAISPPGSVCVSGTGEIDFTGSLAEVPTGQGAVLEFTVTNV